MEIKKLVQEVFDMVLPVIQIDAGLEISLKPSSRVITMLEEIKPYVGEAYGDIVADIEDTDNHGDFRKRLRKALENNTQLEKELKSHLEEIKTINEKDGHTNIQKSKNINVGSNIKIDGNYHQGDVTTTNNYSNENVENVNHQLNIENNHSPIHIGDVIHIQQVVESAKQSSEEFSIPKELQIIQDHITKNRIKDAIEELLITTRKMNPQFHNEAILLAGRWNRLKQNQRMGIITDSDSNIEENKILAALLDTIQGFE